MEEYYFLFAVAFIWVIFATVQDLRTREISNWLNFSLIAFVLAYRGFYSVMNKDLMFFVYGFLGILFFVVLAHIFYYGKVFAGGDAKLLMGLGGVLPYESFLGLLFMGIGFIFLLFFSGAIYTLIYSVFLVGKHKKNFGKEFKKEFGKSGKWFYMLIILGVVLEVFNYFYGFAFYGAFLIILIVFPLIFMYVKAVEKSCMIKMVSPGKLTIGDWLEKDVKIGRRTIKKSVHGLNQKDINLLKKRGRRVLIKEGVPFTPAFLIALVLFILFWLGYSPFEFYDFGLF